MLFILQSKDMIEVLQKLSSAFKKHLFWLFLISIGTSGYAQLQWDARELEFRPTLQDTNLVANFTFKNLGADAVAITQVKTSCGCTTATFDKKKYLRGENGKVTINFAFGERVGLQEKTIIVNTDAPTESMVLLKLKAFIPELVKTTPTYLSWGKGEEQTSKSMTLKILNDLPIRLLEVKSNNPKIVPSLKTVEAGKEYELTVTPSDTNEKTFAILSVTSDFPSGKPRVFRFFAHIK